MTDRLDELRQVGEELRSLFAQERKAIAALDHATLETLRGLKQIAAARLQELASSLEPSPALAALFRAVRAEAQATAMLAATATQAVRVLLGYEPSGSYDRRARTLTGTPMRVLATP